MAKRAARPSGKGDKQFLRDSKSIHSEIKKARREIAKAPSMEAQAQAVGRLESAGEQLKTLNRSRFERLATERLTTALRAMDDLIKLANQPRYAVILTGYHVAQISEQLNQRGAVVCSALRATLDGQAAKQTVGLFVGVSLFQNGAAAE